MSVVSELSLDDEQIARATRLHRDAVVIDASAVIYRTTSRRPFRWDRFTTGGCTAVNSTVTDTDAGFDVAISQITAERAFIREHEKQLLLVTSVADILEAKASQRGGIIFGPQDTAFLEKELARVTTFRDLGVRIMQLTYQSRNTVADGCGEPNAGRLSRFGIDVVAEMNRLGLLVDLSHVSHESSFHAIEVSTDPVVLTHAHPARLVPHVRAKSDELLKAVADTGGVIGITSLSPFLLEGPGPRPTARHFIDHVKYVVDLVGPDHVGIGLDMDEVKTEEEEVAARARNPELEAAGRHYSWDEYWASDLATPDELPNVTLALVAAGYDDETITKILGGNFLRVFKQVWK